jgi:sRNA-binding carbon storage regulator CsrA
MLVVGVRPRERVYVEDAQSGTIITVQVSQIRSCKQVRLGIDAPETIRIVRQNAKRQKPRE